MTRIDHFRGFVAYWAIPAGHKTAKRGRWRAGPGAELFRTAEAALGELPLVAEDLGVITPPVVRLRKELGFPGMVVLQWAFGGGPRNPHDPANHEEQSVVYTSTHDTDTTRGWFEALPKRQREATGLDAREPSWGLLEIAHGSRAALSIVPAQDVLGLGSEDRMNRPGTAAGNWSWRLRPGQLTDELAARLTGIDAGLGSLAAVRLTRVAVLTSQAQRDDAFSARRERMAALVAELRERTAQVARGGGERGGRASPRARKAHRPRADRPADRPRHGAPRAQRARRVGPLRRTGAERGHRHRHRRRRGPGVRDRRERRDGEGRLVLPADGEEAPARAGGRGAERSAVPVPRRLGRRVPAAPGGGLPGPRPLRAHLLQPGADVRARHPADRRQ